MVSRRLRLSVFSLVFCFHYICYFIRTCFVDSRAGPTGRPASQHFDTVVVLTTVFREMKACFYLCVCLCVLRLFVKASQVLPMWLSPPRLEKALSYLGWMERLSTICLSSLLCVASRGPTPPLLPTEPGAEVDKDYKDFSLHCSTVCQKLK